jgi:hypothetical protein
MTVKATTVASITWIKVSETKLQNASKYFKFSNASFSQTNEILQYYLHKATWLVHVSQSSYAWKTREVNKGIHFFTFKYNDTCRILQLFSFFFLEKYD